MGKRRSIINTLHSMRIFDMLPRKRSLTVLSYHRLGSAVSEPSFEFDSTVFGPSNEEFDSQMRWLAINAQPISENDLLCAIDGSSSLPKRSVLVTFDDAYRDQLTIGLPSLIEHKVPAIFFVTPDIINKRALGFWDRLARAIKLTTKTSIGVNGTFFNLSDKQSAAKEVTEFVKHHLDSDPYVLTTEIERLCETPFLNPDLEDAELMSWDDIKYIDKMRETNGLSIGSHGFTHRLLATLSPSEQLWELKSAKENLEKILSRPIRSLAYPAGSFSAETPSLAIQCGYSALFTFESGVNSQLNPANIKRIPAGNTTSIIACSATFPWALGASYYP